MKPNHAHRCCIGFASSLHRGSIAATRVLHRPIKAEGMSRLMLKSGLGRVGNVRNGVIVTACLGSG